MKCKKALVVVEVEEVLRFEEVEHENIRKENKIL